MADLGSCRITGGGYPERNASLRPCLSERNAVSDHALVSPAEEYFVEQGKVMSYQRGFNSDGGNSNSGVPFMESSGTPYLSLQLNN